MKLPRIDLVRRSDADKVLLCSGLTLPFVLGWVLRIHSIAADATEAPYVSRSFLGIHIPFLWLQVLVHFGLIVLALVVRAKRQRTTPWLVHAEIQLWVVFASISLYTVGPFTTSFSILLLALPVLGYLLFDASAMHRGVLTLVTLTGLGMLLPQLGVLPYAPFFAKAPFEDGRISSQYIAAFGVPSIFIAVVAGIIHTSLVRTLRERTDELERTSRIDSLTGLLNRAAFFARLSEETGRQRRRRDSLAVLMIDVDHFKVVNDTFGHATGDHVLAALAQRIRESVRIGDVPARYGGEEFAVLLPEASLEEARLVAERVREAAHDVRCGEGEASRPISVSVGVAELAAHESPDALLARADDALYASKRAGRDRVTVAEPARAPSGDGA